MNHIVFVVGNYKNGGVPMHSTNLANAFAEKGYSATILVTKEIADDIYFSLHENVSVIVLSDYVKSHKTQAERIVKEREKAISNIKKIRYLSKFNKKIDKKLARKIKELRKGNDIAVFAENYSDATYITFGISYYEIEAEKNNPVFHPGQTANIYLRRKKLATLGRIHPTVQKNFGISVPVYVAVIDFALLLECQNTSIKYKRLPKFPAITRDLSMVVDVNTPVRAIEDIFRMSKTEVRR